MTDTSGLPPAQTAPPVLQPEQAASPAAVEIGAQSSRFNDVVSGLFDADEAQPDLQPARRVLAPQAENPKLHKVLAQNGMGSRLEMEQLIMEGRITVNNEPAHIGQRIQFGDHVKVNGKPIRIRIDPPPARVIAYHKPAGEVVTHDDPQNRPTVFRRLPKLFQGKWQSVGRLDLNTEGLLLFSSSGELANHLMHPRFGLEREYAVRVLGALSREEKQRLTDGVQLDDGMAQFGSIEEGGGEGSNCWYRVTISEGRNREVRRMFEAVGHAVSRLIRIRYGAMLLPRGLKRGAWLELAETDINLLMQAVGSAQPNTSRGPGDGATGPGGRGHNRGPPAGTHWPPTARATATVVASASPTATIFAAFALVLPLTGETGGADVTKRSFHRVGLARSCRAVTALAAFWAVLSNTHAQAGGGLNRIRYANRVGPWAGIGLAPTATSA